LCSLGKKEETGKSWTLKKGTETETGTQKKKQKTEGGSPRLPFIGSFKREKMRALFKIRLSKDWHKKTNALETYG